jgi:hypothetical protein
MSAGSKNEYCDRSGFRSVAGRQHAEDVLDRNPHTPDNRLTSEDGWVVCDAVEKLISAFEMDSICHIILHDNQSNCNITICS